jgi:hypothetical protein
MGVGFLEATDLFGHLDQQFETSSGGFEVFLGLFDFGVEVVVGEETDQRDAETGGGGDEGLGNPAHDGGWIAIVTTDGLEGTHHPGDGSEEAEHGGQGDDGIQDDETAIEAFGSGLGGIDQSAVEGGVAVFEGVAKGAHDEIFGRFADGHCTVHVVGFT